MPQDAACSSAFDTLAHLYVHAFRGLAVDPGGALGGVHHASNHLGTACARFVDRHEVVYLLDWLPVQLQVCGEAGSRLQAPKAISRGEVEPEHGLQPWRIL